MLDGIQMTVVMRSQKDKNLGNFSASWNAVTCPSTGALGASNSSSWKKDHSKFEPNGKSLSSFDIIQYYKDV